MRNRLIIVVKIIIAVCCFLLIENMLRYVLLDDANSYTRVSIHQMQDSDRNIDILFVGSSHVYRSLVPEITDDIFDCYTFNAGSSSQNLDGSLALIKEAARNNKIKKVYLELYYGIAQKVNYDDRTELTSTYIISDYLNLSWNKINYLLNASSKEYWVNSFIVARRYWQKLFDINYLKKVIYSKQSSKYKNYILDKQEGEFEYYVDRGFVANDGSFEGNIWNNFEVFDKIPIGDMIVRNNDWEKSLSEIITFCQENSIELRFFVAPMPQGTLVAKQNYQEYYDFIFQLSNDYNIDLIDFNLCKDEYFDCNDLSLFFDEDHLNTKGAKQFSELFSNYYLGNISKDELLYVSFSSKIKNGNKSIYGVVGPKIEKKSQLKKYYLLTNDAIHNQYKITLVTEDGERLYQDFSNNKCISIPINETGTMVIEYRNPFYSLDSETMNIQY